MDWSTQEDTQLIQYVDEWQKRRWIWIAQSFPNKNAQECEERWKKLHPIVKSTVIRPAKKSRITKWSIRNSTIQTSSLSNKITGKRIFRYVFPTRLQKSVDSFVNWNTRKHK